jgi:tRNA pseudouridine13 synthase
MKLKRLPSDFFVEEQLAPLPEGGPYALYRLTKESLGTPEAVDAVLQRWKLSRHDLAYAGLKDKHARTVQYLSIRRGPRRGWRQAHLELEYLGQTRRPVHPRDIVANRFVLVLRDLAKAELASMHAALDEVARDGLPNYFDQQRFGSVTDAGEFIAKPWCLGDYERALWLALAAPNRHDPPALRQQKAILRQHWGDWACCKAQLQRSHARSIVTFLADHPGDFRRALALIRHDLRSLWLAAYQSHVWNCVLGRLIRQLCPLQQRVDRRIGPDVLPFFLRLDDEQRRELATLNLPLPSARLHLAGSPLAPLYEETLAAEGLTLRQMRLKYPRDTFFSKGTRPALLQPGGLTREEGDDELYPGQRKLILRFTLPRGSYATILVKRIATATAAQHLHDEP